MTLYFFLEASDIPCICQAELETQMEVLNGFLSNGNVLQSAYLMDENGLRTDLPVEAFDGAAIAVGMRKLTWEYQNVLGMKSRT